MTSQDDLEFYRSLAEMTAVSNSPIENASLPDVVPLIRYVQGLLIHEAWTSRYGVELSNKRRNEVHIRRSDEILKQITALDNRPLFAPRPPAKRLVGTCRHFSVLLVALLRQQGVPARARCGFATYFTPGQFEDHWVSEYWSDAEARWVRLDAQLDVLQREGLNLDFDPLDVLRNRFLVVGDAWRQCRAGEADPARLGIHEMSGFWFVAANPLRDLAALNKVEMLPWDVWGAIPSPDEPLQAEQLELFDRVAALIHGSVVSVMELRALYEDDRLQVPEIVFNAVLGRPEKVTPPSPNR